MKSIINPLILTFCLGIFSSCGNNTVSKESVDSTVAMAESPVEEMPVEERSEELTSADYNLSSASSRQKTVKFVPLSIIPNYIRAQATSVINDDGIHKLIYTTHLKFKVKDVPQSTYLIEQIIQNNKGHIIESSIHNNRSSDIINISKDSALILSSDCLTGNLKLRVPREQLDTVLREIAPLAVLIDYRTIEARDVTFDIIKAELDRICSLEKEQRMKNAVSSNGHRLYDITNAENAIESAREAADNAKLADYRLKDQIDYSDISILLYQSLTQSEEVISRDIVLKSYDSYMSVRMLQALANGWSGVCTFFILIMNVWPLILIAIFLTIVYLRFYKRRRMTK